MSKLHTVSLAPTVTKYKKNTVADEFVWGDVERRCTKKDSNGRIREGAFGACFSAKLDLASLDPSDSLNDVAQAILERAASLGVPYTKEKAIRDAKHLLSMKANLKKGSLVALKRGTAVFAIAVLTSDYYFAKDEACGWHSWTYRVIEHIAEADQVKVPAFRKTFVPKSFALPEGFLNRLTVE